MEVAGEGWAGAFMGMEPGVAGVDGGSGPLGDGGLGVEAAGGEDLWQSSQVTIFDPAVEGAQVRGVGGGLKAALGGDAGEAVAGGGKGVFEGGPPVDEGSVVGGGSGGGRCCFLVEQRVEVWPLAKEGGGRTAAAGAVGRRRRGAGEEAKDDWAVVGGVGAFGVGAWVEGPGEGGVREKGGGGVKPVDTGSPGVTEAGEVAARGVEVAVNVRGVGEESGPESGGAAI